MNEVFNVKNKCYFTQINFLEILDMSVNMYLISLSDQ